MSQTKLFSLFEKRGGESKTVVVHIKRDQGQITQDCDVYIGRECKMGGWNLSQSIWYNPFSLQKYGGDRTKVLQLYEKYIRNNASLLSRIDELQGKRLGCWCKPKACHGDVLVKLLKERALSLPLPSSSSSMSDNQKVKKH